MDAALPASPRAARRAQVNPRWRILLTYWWRHGRLPDLANPRLFTELVQARKLAGHDRTMVQMADKVVAKTRVAEALGPEWLIPTLWQGSRLPEVAPWPAPFVVKARHGCKQNAFVFDAAADWPAIRARAAGWVNHCYGYWLDESLYAAIPRGLLVEPFIGVGTIPPLDYKLHVFGGRVEAIQVHLDRHGRHRWMVFDRKWHRISAPSADPDAAPPASLSRMIDAAETLSDGRDYCRVDVYDVDGHPLFGEMTFYPGSGLDRFDPVSLDALLGGYWLDALDRPQSAAGGIQRRELLGR